MLNIENDKSTVTVGEDEIFVCQYHDNVTLQPADIQVVVENYDSYAGERDLKVLLVFPKNCSVSSAARQAGENRERPAMAEALVIESTLQRILFKFYKRSRKVQYPIKEFSNRESAISWLKNR
ncbi:MAG: hypothetical protein ACI857_001492 [Arenicella sp.]|jgi:hypothetical protein